MFLVRLIPAFAVLATPAGRVERADSVMVMVAARQLNPGVPIQADDLVAVEVLPSQVPDGVFLSPTHLIGQCPQERILPNELVRGARLSHARTGQGLNAVVPRGMRAISIEIANADDVQGFLKPGSEVDVLVTLEKPRAEDETHTVWQAAPVLSVRPPNLTLLLHPEGAEQIVSAQQRGELTVTLGCHEGSMPKALPNPCPGPGSTPPRLRQDAPSPSTSQPTRTRRVPSTPNFVMIDEH